MGRTQTRPSPRCPTWSIVTSASSPPRAILQGIPAAPGRVAAPIWRWNEVTLNASAPGLTGPAGLERLRQVIEQVKDDLAAKTARLQAYGATAEAGILEAQGLMLDDPALLEGAIELIKRGRRADDAVAEAMAPFVEMLRASDDPVFQARAADVLDVVEQVRRALHGTAAMPPPPAQPSV